MNLTFHKKHLLIFVFLFSLKGIAQNTQVKQADVTGCWLNSLEENAENATTDIYRHCNYKEFRLSRFRFKMELHPTGACRYLYMAPNDAQKLLKGTWKFNAATSVLEIMDAKGVSVHKFKVVRAKSDLLEIERKK